VDLRALLRDAPPFHVDEGLRPRSLRASDEVLETIAAAVQPGWRTLETGAGLSTVVFALSGAEHVCITPAAAEVERIRDYCASRRIALDRVTFHVERSELVLPRLALPELDLVLIDGGHGFPTPFLDWFHGAERLRVGGLLVVDDIQLWTGCVLRDFLVEEPGWTLRDEFAMRAAVFEKTARSPVLPEWFAQPFVRRRSHPAGTLGHAVLKAWRSVRRGKCGGRTAGAVTNRGGRGDRRD
jgi:predicted O-methyltransferase YrrM